MPILRTPEIPIPNEWFKEYFGSTSPFLHDSKAARFVSEAMVVNLKTVAPSYAAEVVADLKGPHRGGANRYLGKDFITYYLARAISAIVSKTDWNSDSPEAVYSTARIVERSMEKPTLAKRLRSDADAYADANEIGDPRYTEILGNIARGVDKSFRPERRDQILGILMEDKNFDDRMDRALVIARGLSQPRAHFPVGNVFENGYGMKTPEKETEKN